MKYKFGTCFVAVSLFVLGLMLGGCGNDSHLEVTEQNVPNPAIPPLQSNPNPERERERIDPSIRIEPLPADPAPPVIVRPMPPTFSGAASTHAAARASFTFLVPMRLGFVPVWNRDFARASFQDCAYIEAEGKAPLWSIYFRSGTEGGAVTVPSMRIAYYGTLTNGNATINGNGRTLFQQTATEDVFVKNYMGLNLGGDRTSATTFDNLYENMTVGRNSSSCTIRFTDTAGNTITEPNGSDPVRVTFNCLTIRNRKGAPGGRWLSVSGSASCAFRQTENYPATQMERVTR